MMKGTYLPGNSSVELREIPVPEPGHGEVLLRMKSSTICGSDIRCIYHEHLGKGPEGYPGVVAGHEPCGHIVKIGPGWRRFAAGCRVIVYHISGWGVCNDCRTIYGSWVTSTWLMEELVDRLVAWKLHPADLVTHRFPLERVSEAYALMASGGCGKVAVCFDEELVSS